MPSHSFLVGAWLSGAALCVFVTECAYAFSATAMPNLVPFPLPVLLELGSWLFFPVLALLLTASAVAWAVGRKPVPSIAVVALGGLMFVILFLPRWGRLYVEAQRPQLSALAALVDQGRLSPGDTLPLRYRYLSADGKLHEEAGCLSMSLWHSWREEDGLALVRCPGAQPTQLFSTTAGDEGQATLDLGDGWWLVQ